MKAITASTLGLVLLVAAAVAAQQPPNFSGRWTLSQDQTPGPYMTVKHEGTTLAVTRSVPPLPPGAGGGAEPQQAFILDGKEHKNTLPSQGSEIVTLYTATWKGDALTIVSTSTYPNGKVMNQTLVWSMDAQRQLIVDVTEAIGGGPKTTMRYLHKKQ